MLVLLCATYTSCSKTEKRGENLQTGSGLDPDTHIMAAPRTQFKAGEAFSLLLKPVQFRDTFVDLIIYSIDAGGNTHRSRSIAISVDTNEDFFQIVDAFQIPFSGRFRITFEQLGVRLGWADVKIKD